MLAPLLLLLMAQAQDPVEVRARLSESEIEAGSTTVLRVDVETEGERAQIGRFRTLPPGIELAGTRDYDQRQFSLPGGVRRFISREFVLRARAAGQFRIPAVEVSVGTRVYSTSTSLLTVRSAPRAGDADAEANADGVILRAWLDSDTVFVGEQVTLEVEALFSQDARLRLRRAPQYEPPSPSGFWIHDLSGSGRPASRRVGGEVYEAQSFRRAFFPLSEGRYEIPPATLEYEMRRGMLYAPETRVVRSDPLPLLVRPLPEAGQPPSFTGAVGRYDVRGWLAPASVPAGEAAVLTVEVEGTGNVKALPPPELPELEGVEVFPPTEESESGTEAGRLRGRKRFSWVLIPGEAGELVIPPIRYAYFDPAAARYDTAEVAALTLTVEPGAVGADEAAPAATLRYLKSSPAADDPLAFVRSAWFLALQALPLILLAGALVRLRQRGRRSRGSRSSLRRARVAGIRELEERAGSQDPRLLADAEAFARSWLAGRLGLGAGEATDPAALVAVGVRPDTASSLAGILQRLAAARYAPAPPGPEARRGLVRALGRVLDRVDREAPAPGRAAGGRGRGSRGATGRGARSAGSGGAALFLLIAVGYSAGQAVPAAGQDPAGAAATAFERGRVLFDAGRYREAAEAFQHHLERHPDDAAAWYNAGTAHHRAGEPGRAAWAWLHVPRLDPRDGDTRHNLRIAGVAPELVERVAPAVPLRTEEALLLGAVAWLAAGIAGAWWVLRGIRTAGAVAAVALLLALGLAAAAWDSTRGSETLIVLDASSLRAGPNLRAELLSPVPPGTGLIPLAQQGAWVRARTLRGEEGWIEAQQTGSL